MNGMLRSSMSRWTRVRLAVALALAIVPPLCAFAAEDAVLPSPDGTDAESEPVPPPQAPTLQEHVLPDLLPEEQMDPIILLGELRSAVRTSPDRVDDRVKLAQVLYQIGDLDAALE